MIEITLPWPPSVNHYWGQKIAGRFIKVYLTDKAKAFKSDVYACVLQSGCSRNLAGRLRVTVYAHVPDKRKRDLDNLNKGLLDALTASGLWLDDEQIDELSIIRCCKAPGGKIRLRVEEIKR